MNPHPTESTPPENDGELEGLLARILEKLEAEPGAELERLVLDHPRESRWLRERLARLERAGLVRRAAGGEHQPPPLAGGEPLPEQLIAGRYRALSEIARGGMGRVLLAQDERLGREVAIKLTTSGGEESSARLEREARLLSRMEHPNIVAVYDGGSTFDGSTFCAMRVVGGRTLYQVIASAQHEPEVVQEFGLARKVQIAISICEAMSFAHSRRVVHRDLKPANVMIGEHGEVQIVDWGLAKRIADPDPEVPSDPRSFASFAAGVYETVDGYAFGTPSYCSPEQALGEVAAIDDRSDVFGIGAILHHLLAGRPPYYGRDRAEVLERARLGRVNDPELVRGPWRVPPELVAICRKACAAAKGERYASVRELAADLRAFLETRTVKAYRSGAWAEVSNWLRRRRLAVGLIGALVAAALAARVAWIESHTRRELQLTTDALTAPYLLEVGDGIGPWYPRAIPELETWIEDSQAIMGRMEELRRGIAEAAERGETAKGPDGARARVFEKAAASLTELLDPESGLIVAMNERLDAARTVEERSVSGADARQRWDEARYSIADVGTCPEYGGLEIDPQLGLLPIGPDPVSGLWEFAALLTGEAPSRDGDGHIEFGEEDAVVLVLIPGGKFGMGAQRLDPSGPSYDPGALENEQPVTEVPLDPFFLSKYELTQAQWVRLARSNPSYFSAGGTYDGKEFSLLHPVESISWDDGRKFLRLAGLDLPTEAQWEYAARAMTTTIYWTGADETSLQGAANIADMACKRIYPNPDGHFAGIDDGWALHAPVSFGRPNLFGLHGMIGNVTEWCRDAYAWYGEPAAPGDGDRSANPWNGDAHIKVARDCSYYHAGGFVRVSHRFQQPSDFRDVTQGIRAARALER